MSRYEAQQHMCRHYNWSTILAVSRDYKTLLPAGQESVSRLLPVATSLAFTRFPGLVA